MGKEERKELEALVGHASEVDTYDKVLAQVPTKMWQVLGHHVGGSNRLAHRPPPNREAW